MSDRAHAWRPVLELDSARRPMGGDSNRLRLAIAAGADLRVYSEFWHDEHIEPRSSRHELVQETMDFRATYLLDERWVAGILTLRQPVQLPFEFGPRPSLSLFLYNENGQQAIARPHLDGPPVAGMPGPAVAQSHSEMPKYHELDRFDDATNAPSSNFVYDFERLRFFIRDDWREVLSHSAEGEVLSGSRDAVAHAFAQGVEWKVGIRGLCDDFSLPGTAPLNHEVFIQLGSCYRYTDEGVIIGGSHPVARVRPAIPLVYASRAWDYAWLLPRSDGQCAILRYDPYSLRPHRLLERFAMRWFCR